MKNYEGQQLNIEFNNKRYTIKIDSKNHAPGAGVISPDSPLGRAILDADTDNFSVKTPLGSFNFNLIHN